MEGARDWLEINAMELDLCHFKANAERRGKPFVIEIWKGWDEALGGDVFGTIISGGSKV